MRELRYKPEGFLLDTPGNKEALSSLANLERAFAEHTVLEAVPELCDREKALHFSLCGIPSVMEKEEALYLKPPGKIKDIAIISRVGRPVQFYIKEIAADRGALTLFLSRRALQKDATDYFMKTLVPGLVIRARVTHLEPFGAFCDIGGGVISLIGIENISVSRISHAKDRFRKDENIFAVVSSIDPELERVTLSHKELLGTWAENAKRFTIGETVTGIVRSIESYGIFTELSPNLSGLAEYQSGLSEGMQVSVFIKNILPEKNKIKLIIINSSGEAIPGDVTKHYSIPGDMITDFHYF